MKTRFENIQLTLVSEKNSLPINNKIFGSIKVNEDLTEAKFDEIPFFQISGKRKTFTMHHHPLGTVSLNTETDKYRIIINVDINKRGWTKDAENSFIDCLMYLSKRTNA
jgi:hypothetical protein